VPNLSFSKDLPISARVDAIAAAVQAHPVVIVAGATGSGKTTQLPKIMLAMGRATKGLIGVTQPRRIAATSVAARVASELGTPLGTDVGYQIRFEDRTSRQTAVKFMTDGILLAEIQGDRLLRRYDTLIIDEAHERSLTIDFLLGWLKRILPERPDLKVIVSSATIETDRFSQFFAGAPVVQVEGRTFPVDVLYEPPPDDDDLSTAVANAVANVCGLDPHGDILVFLPGEREIREAENELRGRALRHTVVQPLYARLTAAEQSRVFTSIPERRVILATNVAETSVTIPGIVYVIDTGIARLSRYEPRSGTTRLQIEAVSQASAEQRKGRCGRVRDGICVRLYDEQSFLARPAFTDPEIKRTGLAGVILRMKALGLGEVDAFPFLDPPHGRAIAEGYRVLEELGAIDEQRALTPLGQRLAKFPVDPRIARMILAGAEHGCLREMLVVTAALSTQDPRERPRELQQKADDLHKRFRDEGSDFVGLLKLWDFVKEAEKRGSSNLRRTCRDNLLSFMRVREWNEVHRQLEEIAKESKLEARPGKASGEALHRALATGLLSKVGMWTPEKRSYQGMKQTRFLIHPSSALQKKPPQWVMAFELVETSQLFARMAAKVEPEWLIDAAPHLIKRSYSEPHWSERAGRAAVKETCTLFGLTVARERSADYAVVDPAGARRMFIEHALVRGEYKSKGAFQEKNRALFDEAARILDRARRSDMLADEGALFAFFDRRLPAEVVNGKAFELWRERAEHTRQDLLALTLDEIFTGERDLKAADYPDALVLHGVKIPVEYLFNPASDEDGITLSVPLVLLPQLEPGELDWTIPGWHREKIEALLDELPKAVRRELSAIPDLARTIAAQLSPFSGALIPQLTAAVHALTGVRVPDGAFRPHALVPHLRLVCRLVDERGKVVDQSRDVDLLFQRYGAKARAVLQSAPSAIEKRGITAWTVGELPPFVVRRVGHAEVRSYPALVDRGTAVDLVLLESAAAAGAAMRGGVRRLLMIGAKQTLNVIAGKLPPALPRVDHAPSRRSDDEGFRAALLERIVDEAFAIEGEAPLPRDEAAFQRVLAAGLPRLDSTCARLADAVQSVRPELFKTAAALAQAARHPSGQAAIADMYAQLEQLFPEGVLRTISLDRLAHYPRYLRAVQARLSRAVNDPAKDADKHAPLGKQWTAFLARRGSFRDAAAAEALRWSFEELRVAIFAPELKTAVQVSVQKVAAALAALE
jgi:ATP-dependent helicase HrpA